MSFIDLGLSPELLDAVHEAGYSEPTPIQEKAIPHILIGRDLLGTAQTGTGKTAAFLLPMIDILAQGQSKARMPRALILEPTRELAAQIDESMEIYGRFHRLSSALVIGGIGMKEQEQTLDRGVDVVIATPGRLLDLFERGNVVLRGIKILVIDESDRMMDMGFIPDLERIVSLLPPIRQTLLFSATMPPEIRRLADKFLINPREVAVTPPASPAETVNQFLFVVDDRDKREFLRALINSHRVRNALIFCNRKKDVTILYRALAKDGFSVAELHGDMDQVSRMATLERFRNGEVRLLACSDVAARGLDIQGLSHVFNFDVPYNAEDYVHRIGRTGRAGLRGTSFTIATPDEGKSLRAIVELIKRDIPLGELEGWSNLPFEDDDEWGRRRGRRRSAKEKPPKKAETAKRETAKRERPAPAKRERPAPAKRERPAAAKPGKPSGRRRKAAEPEAEAKGAVVGMGDHVPAFLARPIERGKKRPPRKRKGASKRQE